MTLLSLRQSKRRRAAGLGACLALVVVATALAAGCGGSSKAATASGSGRSVQVLATVRRGNLVDSVAGRLQLTSARRKVGVKGIVQVMGQNGSQVAAGQSVTVVFVQRPSGAGQGGFGQGYGSGQSGAPSARPSGIPSGGSGSGYGDGGQSFLGQGGQGAFRGKIAQGTVTSVSAGSNGSVTAMVTIAKLPSSVTAKYMGIAQIEVKVLASNVLLVPTAAIKGSGSSATVQLLASGKTSTQSVVVGQQAGGESEITSGLSEGQNVIYMRTFTGRFPGGFRSGGGQSGGSTQNSTQSNGAASGT